MTPPPYKYRASHLLVVLPCPKILWKNEGWRHPNPSPAPAAAAPSPVRRAPGGIPSPGGPGNNLGGLRRERRASPLLPLARHKRKVVLSPPAPFCPGTKALGCSPRGSGLADSSDCRSPAAARRPPPLLMMLIRNHAGQPPGRGEERGVGSA